MFPMRTGARSEIPTSSMATDGTVEVRWPDSEAVRAMRASGVAAVWRREAEQNPSLIASVRTHPEAAYRYMIAVLSELRLAGAERIALQAQE